MDRKKLAIQISRALPVVYKLHNTVGGGGRHGIINGEVRERADTPSLLQFLNNLKTTTSSHSNSCLFLFSFLLKECMVNRNERKRVVNFMLFLFIGKFFLFKGPSNSFLMYIITGKKMNSLAKHIFFIYCRYTFNFF